MAAAAASQAPPAVVPDSAITTKSSEEHHGIPGAVFFDDITSMVDEHGATALLDKLSALSQKYRFFEEKLTKSRDTLEEKIAEVQRALKAVKALSERHNRSNVSSKDIETQFELSDGIYVKATIPESSTVCLWLGANVMVEYTHSEAIDLLSRNLKSAKDNFTETVYDINYLRDQLNTTDVNISRVYNHHIQSVRNTSKGKKST